MGIKIGCDPELFVKDAEGNLVSAHGMVAGSKEKPEEVQCGAIQVDGMALEYNIDPAETVDEFVGYNLEVQRQLMAKLPFGCEFYINPLARFGKEMIDEQPEEARELGCDPDYNAYTGQVNPCPNVDLPYRSASGHIHIGWTEGKDIDDPSHFVECRIVAILLDRYLTIESMAYEPSREGKARRTLYGRAGAFRPKPYGMEYRVLSNFWIKDEKYMRWVFDKVNAILSNEKIHKWVQAGGLTFPNGANGEVNIYHDWNYGKDIINGETGFNITKKHIAIAINRLNEEFERSPQRYDADLVYNVLGGW